jgi:chemotaxis response regulator CheB
MAFVVIHHVRTLPTPLPRLLAGWTEMPVETVSHGLQLRPNQVYVLPSGKEIELMDGSFGLRQRTKPKGWANVISLFVDSLSKSGHLGIAVILSGLDADGAQALAKFSQEGGITIVQDPKTAKNPQMPEAAIRTGHVNYVLPPDAIADRLEHCGEELSTAEAYV